MGYAGDITPQQAWDLLREDENAVLIDVRTEGEWRQIGVPDTASLDRPTYFLEWVDGTGTRNPAFADQLAKLLETRPADAPVVFLCRSGQRSAHAATVATQLGLTPSYNVLEGFEGGIGPDGTRGHEGWRAHGLPWRQR